MNIISTAARLAVVALPALAMMACAPTRVDQANRTNFAGADFNQQLARNYKDLANYEAYQMVDWPSANMYGEKAVAAGAGRQVAPLDPQAWVGTYPARHVRGDDKMTELLQARTRMMNAFSNGAIQRYPVDAAYAQSNYDCWVEEQAEGWQFDHIAACKNGFLRAMSVLEQTQTTQQTTQQVQQGPFLVFFDWDKSVLTADARRVLDQVVTRERNNTQGFHLIGHADKSGPDNYNMKLSQRRADAVKAYLVSKGIAANRITTEARGERDPLVQTADGVREPQNRRVAINIMGRAPGA
jgi:OOP family OmpA-OmpF porin